MTVAFASIENYLTQYPNTATTSEERAQVVAALDAACEDIRKYCGSQDLSLVTGDTAVLHGNGKHLLLLPQLPIVAVNTVTIDLGLPTEIDVTNFRVDLQTGHLYRPPDLTIDEDPWFWGDCGWWPGLSGWPLGFGNVTVNYNHGYNPVPQNLINVAVQLARDTVISPPSKLRGEKISDYSYTRYEGYAGVDDFSTVLDRYKVNQSPVA